jgi:hypothetical protein
VDYQWTPAGAMRSIVNVLDPITAQDSMGGDVLSPRTTLYANVPAKATSKGGAEQFAQSQFQPKRIWEIRMRWLPNISELNDLTIADDLDSTRHLLDIQTVEDIGFLHRELLITCLERVSWQGLG